MKWRTAKLKIPDRYKKHMKRPSRPKFRLISPLVATVLIIAMTLISAIFIGGFVFGIFGSSSLTANVNATGIHLRAIDFNHNGTALPTCSQTTNNSPSYIALSNSGTAAADVTGITIYWAGEINSYQMIGQCSIGQLGSYSSYTYIGFPNSTRLSMNPAIGKTFSGAVTLSNGASILFEGTWQ